ncbi:MAG: cytochrome c3 family protein [candidate division Zixibacteria bacterium]|nr:cytochrome c3 family protein [candidate division Zixibacteria bacterium]
MPQIFPKWTNKLPLALLILAVFSGSAVVAGFWYLGSPRNTDVGYRPRQPVAYSHKLHAGDLGIDCRYCHLSVETSAVAGLPPTQICMNCHTLVGAKNDNLFPVRESWELGQPIEWVRVHNLPDYAYFDHSIHVNASVGCKSCHGRIDQMAVVTQQEPLSMGWCLDCHRHPEMHLQPADEVTNMDWKPPIYQTDIAAKIMKERSLSPTQDCTGCHF